MGWGLSEKRYERLEVSSISRRIKGVGIFLIILAIIGFGLALDPENIVAEMQEGNDPKYRLFSGMPIILLRGIMLAFGILFAVTAHSFIRRSLKGDELLLTLSPEGIRLLESGDMLLWDDITKIRTVQNQLWILTADNRQLPRYGWFQISPEREEVFAFVKHYAPHLLEKWP